MSTLRLVGEVLLLSIVLSVAAAFVIVSMVDEIAAFRNWRDERDHFKNLARHDAKRAILRNRQDVSK